MALGCGSSSATMWTTWLYLTSATTAPGGLSQPAVGPAVETWSRCWIVDVGVPVRRFDNILFSRDDDPTAELKTCGLSDRIAALVQSASELCTKVMHVGRTSAAREMNDHGWVALPLPTTAAVHCQCARYVVTCCAGWFLVGLFVRLFVRLSASVGVSVSPFPSRSTPCRTGSGASFCAHHRLAGSRRRPKTRQGAGIQGRAAAIGTTKAPTTPRRVCNGLSEGDRCGFRCDRCGFTLSLRLLTLPMMPHAYPSH